MSYLLFQTDTHVGTRKLILLDYDLATVNILLDLLYKGEADSVGEDCDKYISQKNKMN